MDSSEYDFTTAEYTPLLHEDAIELTEYHHKRWVFQHFGHLFPCGIRIIFDSITYYLLHYWEFYLSREDVRPIPQGHHLFDPGDDIGLTAIPLWVRV